MLDRGNAVILAIVCFVVAIVLLFVGDVELKWPLAFIAGGLAFLAASNVRRIP